jgi:hypothetical protein
MTGKPVARGRPEHFAARVLWVQALLFGFLAGVLVAGSGPLRAALAVPLSVPLTAGVLAGVYGLASGVVARVPEPRAVRVLGGASVALAVVLLLGVVLNPWEAPGWVRVAFLAAADVAVVLGALTLSGTGRPAAKLSVSGGPSARGPSRSRRLPAG